MKYPTIPGITLSSFVLSVAVSPILAAEEQAVYRITPELRQRCLKVLRAGMRSDEFWPSIHAAEGLTTGGQGREVVAFLAPKLKTETDDQKRCGLSREMVRAGDRAQRAVLFEILADKDSNGRIHAAESLYKVAPGDKEQLLQNAFEKGEAKTLRLMAAAALGKSGNRRALKFVREGLADKKQDSAMIAAWVLARIGDSADIPALRKNLLRMTKPVPKAFFEHALARLGDAEGQKALLRNLSNNDPAIRPYAAIFAGEARMLSAVDPLQKLLDNKTLDVRIRAAQALLMLAQPAPQ